VAIQFGFVCFVSLPNLVSTKAHCLFVYVGICTILPRKGKDPNIAKCNDTVLNVNIFLKKLCIREQIECVDASWGFQLYTYYFIWIQKGYNFVSNFRTTFKQNYTYSPTIWFIVRYMLLLFVPYKWKIVKLWN
jgi:hypothetical protein